MRTDNRLTGWEAVACYYGEYTQMIRACEVLASLAETASGKAFDCDMVNDCAEVLAMAQQMEYLLHGKDMIFTSRAGKAEHLLPACCRAIVVLAKAANHPERNCRETILHSFAHVVSCIRDWEQKHGKETDIRRAKKRALERERRAIAKEEQA